jgi:predicted alpha/beta-fold hydrolase
MKAQVWPDRRPPLGLAGPHVQTILGTLRPRGRRLNPNLHALTAPRVLSLPGGVRLAGLYTPGTDGRKGLVVLLHGWEGGADSGYLRSSARLLHEAGYACFRLNFRDHGGTHALNEELFHSCRIVEVVDAVAALQRLYAPTRLTLVGYSLGGNFALRVAARAPAARIRLDGVVAVCPVLHPPHTMHALEAGFVGYHYYFLRKWRRSLLAKQACFPTRYRLGDLRRFRTLTATTDFFIREYTDFPDLDGYLNGYSILGDALRGLEVQAHIIAAADDPVIPSDDLDALAQSAKLEVSLLPWGGHCGFLANYRLASAIEPMILDRLAGCSA